jgi:serine protease Do
MSARTAFVILGLLGLLADGAACAQQAPAITQPQAAQPPAARAPAPQASKQSLGEGPSPLSSAAGAQAAPNDFVAIAKPLLGAVVNVSSEHRGGRQNQEGQSLPPPFNEMIPQNPEGGPDQPSGRGVALGSGFIIDGSGYVVTNNHVVEDANKITVVLHDQREFKATVVGRDGRTDLALLKIEAPQPLPFVRWGNSDSAQVGQWILAIGNPFGLGGTVTSGIISATARDIGAGPYDAFLQTDASINRGNSGGPMFNMNGEVIGVNTAIFSPNGGSIGIGFAIPASLAKPVIDQLRNNGEVRRGWLGVAIQPVNREIAESLQLPNPVGALVADVTKDGPADKAGLKVGDVVLRYNGEPVDEHHRLPRLVADTRIGSGADIVVWRDGREHTLHAQIAQLRPRVARLERHQEPVAEAGPLGLAVAPLTPETRSELGMETGEKGVLVHGVLANSDAAERGISPGDIIQQVNQRTIGSPADFRQALEQAEQAHRETVLLLVRHGDSRHFVPVPLDTQNSEATPPRTRRNGG